jgi:hypothetical protein
LLTKSTEKGSQVWQPPYDSRAARVFEWRKFRSKFKRETDRQDKVSTTCAAKDDQPDGVKYIYGQGIDDNYAEMLLNWVRKGHANTVAWLIEHVPKRERIPEYSVSHPSPKYGRLEI